MLWAVDEAVDRNAPLSLLCAIDDGAGTVANEPPADVATAESAVRDAVTLIESLGKHVKVAADIVHRRPAAALAEASRSAAVVCVGSIGLDHALRGRIGATASALVASAHCPVAVVPRTAHRARGRTAPVLAVVDGSSARDRVLELGIAEARLRAAPLRIFTLRPSGRGRSHETAAPPGQRSTTDLERTLAYWRGKQPGLTIDSVSDRNGLLNYLEHLQRATTPIQLVVVGPQRPGPVETLTGASGRAVLEATGCTLMACDRVWRL